MVGPTGARIWVAFAIAAVTAVDLTGVPAERSQAKPAAAIPEVVRLPPGMQLTRMRQGPSRTEVALAPDGTSVVFSATPDGTMAKAMLYRRPLDREEATVMPGTEAACMPFFSPDGQWIGFWAKGKLLKVAVKGGAPSPICSLPVRPVGICWGLDGRVIFGTLESGLGYVSAGGGTPETLTTVDATSEATHRLPHLLPNGKALMFTVWPGGAESRIEWLSLETGQRKVLMEDGADARYLPTGHLVFVRKGALMAAPFSLERLETTGPAVVVIARLMQASNESMPDSNSGAGQYSVSVSGTLVAVAGGVFPNPPFQPYWVDRSGRAEARGALAGRAALGPRVSPDGRRVAFRSPGLDKNLWIHDIQRNTSTRLTSAGNANFPAWTPDGRHVAFSWSTTAAQNVWWQASDGSGKMERLTTSEFDQSPASWTRDGRHLALVEAKPGMRYDILVLRMADRKLIPFAVTKSDEAYPEFSPDGRWLAYASNELERNEIYLRSFPDGKKTLRISDGGGIAPLWAPDGRELFYWNLEYTRLMKVAIVPGQDVPAGTPKVLFEYAAGWALQLRNYDISPDGRRFLIRELQKYDPKPVTELHLVRNWFEELRRLSPAPR